MLQFYHNLDKGLDFPIVKGKKVIVLLRKLITSMILIMLMTRSLVLS